MSKRLLITGGAGFIGSAFVRMICNFEEVERIVNLDLLTYAGSISHIKECEKNPRYLFIRGDISNGILIEEICRTHQIDTIVHFAAESHVDRSIADPLIFYRTNVGGTIALLEVVRRMPHIHFHHVSTDEVYGSIEEGECIEDSPYRPNSPYAASKAASDHFVRAYHRTYGISVTSSHCGNNYGPYQNEEKFIPRMITSCIKKESFPIYGNGKNVRDWIFVEDHVEAIWKIITHGKKGESYNISAGVELCNLDLVYLIIDRFSILQGKDPQLLHPYIAFIADRPGHDWRYALNANKLRNSLNWKPKCSFYESLDRTIRWMLPV